MGIFKKIVSVLSLVLLISFSSSSWCEVHKKPHKRLAAKKLPLAPDLGMVGDLAYVEGDVTAERVKAPDWLTAYTNMPDYLLDKIKTGDNSKATLVFNDETQVGINKDTEVLIDTNNSVKDITRRTLIKRVYLTLGSIWCKVTKQQGDASFTVQARGGVLGVRGTEFLVSTTGDNKMDVYVLEGTVMAGPSVDELTQAIPAGEEAKIQDGKIQTLEEIRGGIHFVGGIFGMPWEGHFAGDLLIGGLEGEDMGDIGVDFARDYVSGYVPYGGVVNGFFGGSNFFGGHPAQPANLQPQGMVNTYTPTFSWSGINDAKQYAVMVSKAPFQKEMPKEDWIWAARVDKTSVTYPFTAGELFPGATYYWAVVGLDEKGKVVGKGSNPVAFTMAGQDVLGQPTFYPAVLHPMNEAVPTLLPTFTWNPMNGASSYAVLIGSKLKNNELDGDFSVANLSSAGTSATYDLKELPLVPGQTYYWSVVALDQAGKPYSRPSPPVSFTLPQDMMVGPTPLFPVGPVKGGRSLHLEWRGWLSQISGYKVVVSQSPDLSQPVLVQQTTTPWLDLPDDATKLTAGATYYWAVTSMNLEGKPAGVRGQIASFTITP